MNKMSDNKSVIERVRELFCLVDRETERFKGQTGVNCPGMCGVCCTKSEVETTAIEMLPLAAELWKKNKADIWLDKIDTSKHPGLCVFFKEDSKVPGNGRCSIYGLRPLICRLFGFYTVRDKNGKYVYGGCKIIREKFPRLHQKAIEFVARETHPSQITDYSIRIISMGTDLSRKLIPINTATKIALEKIGFEKEIRDSSATAVASE